MREEVPPRRGDLPRRQQSIIDCYVDVALFNVVATLLMISRFWRDRALTNHISEGPGAPLSEGNQYGSCRFEPGGELFDVIVVSNQGRVDEVA